MPLRSEQTPAGPRWMGEQIAKIWRAIAELRAARRLENASIGAGGLSVVDGGSFKVQLPSGLALVFAGQMASPDFDHTDGTPQQGFFITREDGSVALGVYAIPSVAGVNTQAVQLFDRAGHQIVSEDTTSGLGLARPYLPLPIPMPENFGLWPSTTSGTWTTIARSSGVIQHPRLHVNATMGLGANSGQLRFLVDGTVVATGGINSVMDATFNVPNYAFGMTSEFQLQAQVTAGGGTISGMVRYLYGVQS